MQYNSNKYIPNFCLLGGAGDNSSGGIFDGSLL